MDINISNFKFFLEDEIDSLTKEFLSKYIINIRKVEGSELEKINNFLSSIIKYICTGDLQNTYKTCKNLIDFNIELSIPYIMLSHELMNLQKLIIQRLLNKNAKDEIYQLYKLHLIFEDIIAKIYLDKYAKNLQNKNIARMASIGDIYEKNVIIYYHAHLEWLNDLAKSIEFRNNKFSPQLNHNLCTFGKWLNSSGKTIIQNNSKFDIICKQHENLHLMAKQIKSYINKTTENNHIILTYLEKCEMLSLSLGTELALIDNTLINSNASKDPLTGALNRQKLTQLYLNQLEISVATSEPFVLAMCDFDYFKNINDTYGHLAGDKMLEKFVPIVKQSLRNSDMIIRYGGEEFIFILPAIKEEKARELLNKVREDFSKSILDFEEEKISTTLSIGMFEINPDICGISYFRNFENAISIVDKKLYEAKDNGRNMVC
ncbi:MAG: diguanylate cyclase [Aliarcobacter sp.]|nr:diguanylate cyclase [Aliarcobacter sp.]